MNFTTKVIKIGNSAGIIIPQIVLQSLGWKIGDSLYIQVKNKSLILRKEENIKK